MPHVFISYVREDAEAVTKLCKELEMNGIEVWLDRESIHPGVRWRDAIRRAISEGSFFIACFSTSYAKRTRTYMNEELTLAIEELRQRPTNKVWFIPVLLSKCKVPDREIGAGETLHSIHHVRLHEDWETGVRHILSVIELNSSKYLSKVSRRGNKLSIELSQRRFGELEELITQARISEKDFLNQALSLLVWAMKERLSGRIIASVDEKNRQFREVVMPALNLPNSEWLRREV